MVGEVLGEKMTGKCEVRRSDGRGGIQVYKIVGGSSQTTNGFRASGFEEREERRLSCSAGMWCSEDEDAKALGSNICTLLNHAWLALKRRGSRRRQGQVATSSRSRGSDGVADKPSTTRSTMSSNRHEALSRSSEAEGARMLVAPCFAVHLERCL